MFLHKAIADRTAYLMRESREKVKHNLSLNFQGYLSPKEISIRETKDSEGRLHSFKGKPARIVKNPITEVIMYQWYNHGELERGNKPASINKHRIKNLTSVKTFDADGHPHSFNDKPYSVQTLKYLGIFTCFSIKTWHLKGSFEREESKPPIIARYIFGKPISIQMLYNTPITKTNYNRAVKHSQKTKAPLWVSWFLITKAITQEQFDMFRVDGLWVTEVPIKWILYAWNPEGVFQTGNVITPNDAYTSGEYDSGYFMQKTSITATRLLHNLDKD